MPTHRDLPYLQGGPTRTRRPRRRRSRSSSWVTIGASLVVLVAALNVFLAVLAARLVPDTEWVPLVVTVILPTILVVAVVLLSRSFRGAWALPALAVVLALQLVLAVILLTGLDDAMR